SSGARLSLVFGLLAGPPTLPGIGPSVRTRPRPEMKPGSRLGTTAPPSQPAGSGTGQYWCSAALDRRGLERERDPLAHEQPARLARSVPGDAPVLPVHGDGTFEAEAEVAERVLGAPGELQRNGDRTGGALDGPVADDAIVRV